MAIQAKVEEHKLIDQSARHAMASVRARFWSQRPLLLIEAACKDMSLPARMKKQHGCTHIHACKEHPPFKKEVHAHIVWKLKTYGGRRGRERGQNVEGAAGGDHSEGGGRCARAQRQRGRHRVGAQFGSTTQCTLLQTDRRSQSQSRSCPQGLHELLLRWVPFDSALRSA